MDKEPLKLYCVVSREALAKMNGNRGKLGAQCGHAFLHAYMNALEHYREDAESYLEDQRAYKIVLAVDTTEELSHLYIEHVNDCGTAYIQDAGLTVFNEPTYTCLGIGPIRPSQCSEKLKSLKPLI